MSHHSKDKITLFFTLNAAQNTKNNNTHGYGSASYKLPNVKGRPQFVGLIKNETVKSHVPTLDIRFQGHVIYQLTSVSFTDLFIPIDS
jgi:hypothetical protein